MPPPPSRLAPLPVIDSLVDAFIEEALPADRSRLRTYLSARPVGLSLITAGPGFGKTTAVSVFAVAMMARFGKVYCGAPTLVAVDNFAARLDQVACRVVHRNNRDAERKVYLKLVIRAYKLKDEVTAFLRLLQHPHDGDDASPGSSWFAASRWKLHLSLAFWLLVVFQSPGVRQLRPEPDVPEALIELRRKFETSSDLDNLRAVAAGTMTWDEYQQSM